MFPKKISFSFRFSPENLIGSIANMRNFKGKLFKEKKNQQNNPTKTVKPSPQKIKHILVTVKSFLFYLTLFNLRNKTSKTKKPEIITMAPQ